MIKEIKTKRDLQQGSTLFAPCRFGAMGNPQKGRTFIFLSVFCFAIFLLSVSFASAATVKVPTNTGLVGYWSFNEGTTTKAGDFSGRGNTGTLTSMANPATATSGWGNGKLGKGLNFDGTNDYVNAGQGASIKFNATTAITVSAWYNTNITTVQDLVARVQGCSDYANYMLAIGDNAGDTIPDDGKLAFSMKNLGQAKAPTVTPTGTWVHAVGTYDNSNIKLYVNGVLVTTTAASGAMYTNNNNVYIGGDPGCGGRRFVNGKVDEVRIYSRALSATEIATLYSSSKLAVAKAPSNTGLVGYWSFNEGTTTQAGDSSGRGNTGTLTSMANPATATSGWGNGRLGKGLNFDGTNDHLTTARQVVGGTNATYSAWVKYGSVNSTVLGSTGTGPTYIFLFYSDGNMYVGDGASVQVNWPYTASAFSGRWRFLTLVKTGSTLELFFDGVSQGTRTMTNITPVDFIGRGQSDGANYRLTGSLDEVRIYNRALSAAEVLALYTSQSKSATIINSFFSKVVLLLHGDGVDASTTFTDSSPKRRVTTVGGNAQIDTGQKKFGLSSMQFDGTGDYLLQDGSSDFAFGTGDYTVEFWLRSSSLAIETKFLYDSRPTGTNGNYLTIATTPNSTVLVYVNSGTVINSGEVAVVANTWHHLAVSRSGSATKLFIDGIQKGSTWSASTNFLNGASRPAIGVSGLDLSTGALSGWIDDLRVTKGVARYTSNFTPPTRQFSND